MANKLIPPPIKVPMIDLKTGIVDIVWMQFFMQLYHDFSQPSYGPNNVSFVITGITGSYTTDSNFITDRDFVHFNYTITPATGTKLAINDATFLPVFATNEKPLKITNVLITLLDGSTVKDSRTTNVDATGLIAIPNSTLTGYTIKISGSFVKTF